MKDASPSQRFHAAWSEGPLARCGRFLPPPMRYGLQRLSRAGTKDCTPASDASCHSRGRAARPRRRGLKGRWLAANVPFRLRSAVLRRPPREGVSRRHVSAGRFGGPAALHDLFSAALRHQSQRYGGPAALHDPFLPRLCGCQATTELRKGRRSLPNPSRARESLARRAGESLTCAPGSPIIVEHTS